MFAIVGVSKPSPSPPITPRPVITETVRTARADDETFSRRWRPIYDMPPMIQIHEVRYMINGEGHVADTVPGAGTMPPNRTPSRGRPFLQSKPVRLDVCA